MAPGINLPSGEIRRALTAGLHFILVHETRLEHGGCTFKVRELPARPFPCLEAYHSAWLFPRQQCDV